MAPSVIVSAIRDTMLGSMMDLTHHSLSEGALSTISGFFGFLQAQFQNKLVQAGLMREFGYLFSSMYQVVLSKKEDGRFQYGESMISFRRRVYKVAQIALKDLQPAERDRRMVEVYLQGLSTKAFEQVFNAQKSDESLSWEKIVTLTDQTAQRKPEDYKTFLLVELLPLNRFRVRLEDGTVALLPESKRDLVMFERTLLAKADTEDDKEQKTPKQNFKNNPKAANRANAANAGAKRPRDDQREFKEKICEFHKDEPRHKNKRCPDKDAQGNLLFGAARKERAKELEKSAKTKKDDKKEKNDKKAKKEKSKDSETDE